MATMQQQDSAEFLSSVKTVSGERIPHHCGMGTQETNRSKDLGSGQWPWKQGQLLILVDHY